MFATVLRRQIPAMPVQHSKKLSLSNLPTLVTAMSESSILTRQPCMAELAHFMPFPSPECVSLSVNGLSRKYPMAYFFCLLSAAFSTTSVKHQHALPAHSSWLATNRVCICHFFFFSPFPYTTLPRQCTCPKERFLKLPDHLPHTVGSTVRQMG